MVLEWWFRACWRTHTETTAPQGQSMLRACAKHIENMFRVYSKDIQSMFRVWVQHVQKHLESIFRTCSEQSIDGGSLLHAVWEVKSVEDNCWYYSRRYVYWSNRSAGSSACYSVLQCATVCYSVVTVCYSVLQCNTTVTTLQQLTLSHVKQS
jgi:hypothetical protein